MDKTNKKFKTRAFVALTMTFSGLGLPITGIANHIYGFSPLTVARHAWMSAHNVLGILFVAFSIWHIILNRRALWSHINGVATRMLIVRREAVLAGAITALLLILSIGHAFHGGGR